MPQNTAIEHVARVVAYLVKKYWEIYREGLDRLKLVKLLFLADYDIENAKVIKRGVTGIEDWIVYLWGPFSYTVYLAKDYLIDKGLLHEDPENKTIEPASIKDIEDYVRDLDNSTRRVLDNVIKRYGGYDAIELTYYIYRKMKMTPRNKSRFFGKTVDEYIKEVVKR